MVCDVTSPLCVGHSVGGGVERTVPALCHPVVDADGDVSAPDDARRCAAADAKHKNGERVS